MTLTTSTDPTGTVAGAALAKRILDEGYGPGAWHGPDLKAAIGDVSEAVAFKRPAPGRHSIAEIALHHAYCLRSVRAQLTGAAAEKFIAEGEDWFTLERKGKLSWAEVRTVVDEQQSALLDAVAKIETGKIASPLADADRFNLIRGITGHAIYHAGQIQLIKKLVVG